MNITASNCIFAYHTFLRNSDTIIFFLENIQQFNVSDGGKRVMHCQPDNLNATNTTWKIHFRNSSVMSHFIISENSTLVVSNPKSSYLQGLVNYVTCIENGNGANTGKIMYQVVFLKGNGSTVDLLDLYGRKNSL